MPASQQVQKVIPGYRPQQYAAIIAHCTMGKWRTNEASETNIAFDAEPSHGDIEKNGEIVTLTCPHCMKKIFLDIRRIGGSSTKNSVENDALDDKRGVTAPYNKSESVQMGDLVGSKAYLETRTDYLEKIRIHPGRTRDGKPVNGPVEIRAKRDGWRLELIRADVLGLERPLEVYRCARKGQLIKPWDEAGEYSGYCPATWADLAIGSGACGFRCRACFLILTHRTFCDPSRHLLYDNIGDYESEVRKWLVQTNGKYKSMGLGIDCSDSLLYEGVTGHAGRLIPLFADRATNPYNYKLILLTKSTNVRYLEGLPTKNILVTHSLNPEQVADLWEGKFDDGVRITPPMNRRLADSKWAAQMGFEVRWRIDPILDVDGWEDIYKDFFTSAALQGHRPSRITLGTYREANASLETFSRKWGLPALEWNKPVLERSGAHLHIPNRTRIYKIIRLIIKNAWEKIGYQPLVGLCKEDHTLHDAVGTKFGQCNCESAVNTNY